MRFTTPAIAALLSAAIVVPGHAQMKAYTVPISRDTVTIRLVAADTPAKVTVQNGGLARVSVKDGPAMGLVPVIKAQGVELTVLEITRDPVTGNEGLRQVAKVTLARGHVVHFDALALPFEVELLDTVAASAQGPGASGPCTTCCVMCGDIVFCGCLVNTDCGPCCCPAACTCPGSPMTSATSRPSPGSCSASQDRPTPVR